MNFCPTILGAAFPASVGAGMNIESVPGLKAGRGEEKGEKLITIDAAKCTLCGECIPLCVRRILEEGENSVRITDPGMCLYCGHCKAICPSDAFRFSEGNEQFLPVPDKKEIPAAAVFFRFLRRRRSLRSYQDRPVEKTKLKMLVEAGRYAPTGSNRQACEYVVVSGRKTLDRVCTLAIEDLLQQGRAIQEEVDRHSRLKKPLPEELISRQTLPPVWERIARKWEEGVDQLLHHAPALVIIHMKKNLATTPEVDAAIASTQMVLLAETLGLGTCYIGFLIWAIESSAELKKLLGIRLDHKALVSFTVGYPAVEFLRFVARNPAKANWVGEFLD
jgi:nitroreductase/NAD-dependent dihydropyrimidine dehydrogenase PreA subunit